MDGHVLDKRLVYYLHAVGLVGLVAVFQSASLATLDSPLLWASIAGYAVVRSRPAPIGDNSLAFTLSGSMILGSIFAMGGSGAMWVVLIGDLAGELYLGRRPIAKVLFNVGQHALGVATAQAVLSRFGDGRIGVWLAAAAAYCLLNLLLTGTASAMATHERWWPHLNRLSRESAGPFALLGLLGIAAGLAAETAGTLGIAGATVLIVVASREVSSARIYRAILDRLPLGVAIWERHGRCAFANHALRQMSDVSPERWRDFHLQDLSGLLAGPADPPGYMRAVRAGASYVERVRLRSPARGPIPVELTVHPWHRGGDFWGAVTVVRDIRADLEAEINSRLAAVGRLASGAAHEIRNPLTSVRGFLQLAERQGSGAAKQWIQLALAELDRISALVRDLLVYARPQQRADEPIDVLQLAGETLTLVRERAHAQGVETAARVERGTPDPVYVMGDRNQLKQVLLNLFQNALEALPTGGALEVVVALQDEHVLCSVNDTGPGIPAEVRDRLFEPFFTTKEHGTGLGLMISRQIIQQHGGAIEVQSEAGRGTAMIISLPVYRGPLPVERARQGADSAGGTVIPLASRRG